MIFCFYTLAYDVILLLVFSRQKPLWNATTSLGSFSHFRCTLVMVNQHYRQALKSDPLTAKTPRDSVWYYIIKRKSERWQMTAFSITWNNHQGLLILHIFEHDTPLSISSQEEIILCIVSLSHITKLFHGQNVWPMT